MDKETIGKFTRVTETRVVKLEVKLFSAIVNLIDFQKKEDFESVYRCADGIDKLIKPLSDAYLNYSFFSRDFKDLEKAVNLNCDIKCPKYILYSQAIGAKINNYVSPINMNYIKIINLSDEAISITTERIKEIKNYITIKKNLFGKNK